MKKILLLVGFLAVMVGASEGFAQREIVFPEIAAILTGLLLAPRLPWRVNRLQMIAGIMLCALLGTAMAMLPILMALKLTLAYAFAHIILLLLRTSFAPMISAAVLPVLLQAHGWVYPASATILVCLCALLLPREQPVTVLPYAPCPISLFLVRLAVVAAVAALASFSGALFLAAPPLLVAYTQLSAARAQGVGGAPAPLQVIVVVAASALIGVIARDLALLVPAPAQLVFPLAAALSALGFTALFRFARLAFPPAAAMTLLAFIIPETHLLWYPLEVLVGIALLTALSYLKGPHERSN